jgi:hypothetical protein
LSSCDTAGGQRTHEEALPARNRATIGARAWPPA